MTRLALALSLLAVACAGAQEPPQPGLVGQWVFDDAHLQGETVKAVVGPLDGKLLGGAKLRGQGDNRGLALDGRGGGVLLAGPETPPQLPASAITLEAWVAVSRPERWGAFIGYAQDNGNAEQGWFFGYEENRFSFAIASIGADDGDGAMTYIQSTTQFEMNRWYHVAATFDGKEMRLYVNGKPETQSAAQSGDILYPKSSYLEIGGYHDADEYYPMRGRVREVRMYDRALDEAQIEARFATLPPLGTLPPVMAEIVVGPYLQFATQDAITIMWETRDPATSSVSYGERLPLTLEATGPDDVTIHEVRLTGLQPETQYIYSVRSAGADGEDVESDPFAFRTAVKPDSPFSFVVVGDTQSNTEVNSRIYALMYGERPNLALHVGDEVGDGRVKEQWKREMFDPAAVLMRHVPMYVAIGNHEGNSEWFYRYRAYPPPEDYYSFDYGNTHFIMLDSPKGFAPGSEQHAWLEQDLAATKATWKIVCLHYAPYSSDLDDYGNTRAGPGTYGDEEVRKIVPLLEQHGVDMVFFGHIHDYERTWPIREGKVADKGIVYIQTGGGAGGLEDYAPTHTWFTAKVHRDHHYCYVTVNGNALRLTATDIDGRLFDWVELRK